MPGCQDEDDEYDNDEDDENEEDEVEKDEDDSDEDDSDATINNFIRPSRRHSNIQFITVILIFSTSSSSSLYL